MTFKPRLIINADRLGLNSWTNERIFEAFDKGWISSASIMVNMPGFDEALRTIKERNLQGKIGLHLALDIGTPLSEGMTRVMEDGPLGRQRKLMDDDPNALNAVEDEIVRQIDVARESGLPLTHIDSYRHVHTHWSILPEMISVCVDKGIPAMRLAGNFLFPSSQNRQVYCRVVNRRIRAAGFITAQKFTYLNRYLVSEPGADSGMVLELMVRPGVDEESSLFQTPAFGRLLNNFDLISYGDFEIAPDLLQKS